MARGCRDCGTCTRPGAARWTQWWLMAFLHLCTAGISYLVKKGTMKHCPQCGHLLSNHQRRLDGSFRD
jgi:leucyl-tRNA synthetase